MKWKVLESEYLHRDPPWLTTRKDVCELPNGKIMKAYYVHEYPTWVSVFAVTKDEKVILIRQYRHGLGEVLLELPGGVVDEGEQPADAVARELREESGYKFDKFDFLGTISANPATTNNLMHMFLATGGEYEGDQNLDETEDLEVVLVTMDELRAMVRENKLMQSLHLSCILYAFGKLGIWEL